VISVREVNLNQAIRNSGESLKVFLTVGARTDDSLAIAALDADFAEALIAALLNDARRAGGARRELSPIETTIVEFLAAHVLSDINAFLGDSVLYLRGVSGQARDFYESAERGAEITFGVNLGDLRGKVGLFASPGFLRYLDRSRNPLFEKRNQRKKLSDFEKIARAVDLRLQLGTTFLDADSLLYLEPDDIVLIEQPQIGLHGDSFAGNMQIRVGTGANFRLRGAAEASELADGLNFRIEEITSEETRRRSMPAKFKMDEKENDLTPENEFESGSGEDAAGAADEEATPALENVQVALRVEIAGSKISLRELQNMRVGQIIALGTSPHDPVRLVTDNSEDAIAAGELIEIEGQLGVRLTKVFI
jgi:flagellar motor switch/type III secretory pathway protein FliN